MKSPVATEVADRQRNHQRGLFGIQLEVSQKPSTQFYFDTRQPKRSSRNRIIWLWLSSKGKEYHKLSTNSYLIKN